MGIKAEEALEFNDFEDLADYLRTNHAIYVVADNGKQYYLTDVNDHYWRVQYTDQLNEKGHYVDASDLVPTLTEFMDLPFEGRSLREVYPGATFFASVK